MRAIVLFLLAAACGTATPDDLGDGVLDLPPVLREISGVVRTGPHQVACVQDEKGALWLVQLDVPTAPVKLPFGGRGDYEGVAAVGDRYWVLRSDGQLLELVPDGPALRIARTVQLPGPFQDWEGLCFDADHGRLLAMPKDAPKGKRSERVVFAIDPTTATVQPEPVVHFALERWVADARAAGIPLPAHTSSKGKERIDAEMACSELLAVPGRKELLLLAAGDGLLVRIDYTGRLLGLRRLDVARAPQAEGMTWLADGRLLIASEGSGGGRLLVVEPPN